MKTQSIFVLVLIIVFPLTARGAVSDCPEECINVEGHMEQERCATKVLRVAEGKLQKYLKESKRLNDSPDFVKTLNKAQQQWLQFRKATCGAVTRSWSLGTGASVATITCEIDLTRRWTHMVWEYFGDGQQNGKLPEPKNVEIQEKAKNTLKKPK